MTPMDFSAANLDLNGSKMFCIVDSNRGIYIAPTICKTLGQFCAVWYYR